MSHRGTMLAATTGPERIVADAIKRLLGDKTEDNMDVDDTEGEMDVDPANI